MINPLPRWHNFVLRLAAIGLFLALAWTAPAVAMGQGRNLCDAASVQAAERHDVPLDVLMAISRVETGRSVDGIFAPWPWAVNTTGRGDWLADQRRAIAVVREGLASGKTNIDIGCFQLNFKWHGAEFSNLGEMFTPGQNADYAARFLRRLYAEFGSWQAAAGAYHSRTEIHAKRYREKFAQMRQLVALDQRSEGVPKEHRRAVLGSLFRSSDKRSLSQNRASLFGEGAL